MDLNVNVLTSCLKALWSKSRINLAPVNRTEPVLICSYNSTSVIENTEHIILHIFVCSEFCTINISNELMLIFTDTDLHNVIKKGNILKDIHKRYIMYQVSNFASCVHELFGEGLFSSFLPLKVNIYWFYVSSLSIQIALHTECLPEIKS